MSTVCLVVDVLRGIYNADKKLTKALPKMAKAGFTEYLQQTNGHVEGPGLGASFSPESVNAVEKSDRCQ